MALRMACLAVLAFSLRAAGCFAEALGLVASGEFLLLCAQGIGLGVQGRQAFFGRPVVEDLCLALGGPAASLQTRAQRLPGATLLFVLLAGSFLTLDPGPLSSLLALSAGLLVAVVEPSVGMLGLAFGFGAQSQRTLPLPGVPSACYSLGRDLPLGSRGHLRATGSSLGMRGKRDRRRAIPPRPRPETSIVQRVIGAMCGQLVAPLERRLNPEPVQLDLEPIREVICWTRMPRPR
jgi:hypothetical protein